MTVVYIERNEEVARLILQHWLFIHLVTESIIAATATYSSIFRNE
jgi:hypothetical protein